MSFSPRQSRLSRLFALLAVLLMVAGACSSGDDTDDAVSDTGADDSTAVDGGSADDAGSSADDSSGSSGSLTCDELAQPSGLIRGANGWLPQVSDEDSATAIGGDYDAILQAIETLRPIQDIEGIFGTMRQGLDNMAADIVAVQEGRYGDMVGDYSVATMNAVIGEEICGG